MRPDQKKSGWLDDDLGDRHHSIIAWTQCCFTKRGSFRASRFCSIYYRKGSSSVYFVTRTCTYLSISIYISWYDTHIYIYSYLCIKPIWNCIASTPHKLMAGTLQNDGIFDDFRLHKIGVPCWIFGVCPESNNYSTWKLDGWADEEICSLLGGGRDKTAYFQIGGIDHQFSGDGKWTLHFIFLSYRSFRFGLKESTNQTSPKIPSKTLRPDRPLSKVPPRPENGVLIFWKAKIWLEIHPFVSTEPWKPPWLWEGKVSTSISTTQSWLLK